MLSKQAREYLQQNQDMIEQMKSMIEYDFNIGQQDLDLRNLSQLDLTCADLSLLATFNDKEKQDQALDTLSQVADQYTTANIKKVSLNLTTSLNFQFLGQISQIFIINNIELTKTNQTWLTNFLAQQQLRVSGLSINLPEQGFKAIKQSSTSQNNILNNGHLKSLNLNINSNVNDNYQEFSKLLLKCKSIGTFNLNLNNFQYISDSFLAKFFTYATKLYKLTLSNINFSTKNSYIQFCLYISQNNSIQELEINNCQLFDKLKTTLFNCLNDRKPILNSFTLTDCIIDSSNINAITQLIQVNPLKHLHLQNFLKEKPKMLPIQDFFAALNDKQSLTRLIIKDPLIRLGQSINRAINKMFSSRNHIQRFEIETENYEDIFGQLVNQVKIDHLSIKAQQYDKYAISKLFFDITQGNLRIQSLKLSGTFQDQHIQKIVHIQSRHGLKELDLSETQITDEGAIFVSQFLQKTTNLTKLDISNTQIGDSGISVIMNEGFSSKHRLQTFKCNNLPRLKKSGKLDIFSGIKILHYIKELDLSSHIATTLEEAQQLSQFLLYSDSIQDIKLPKIQIANEHEYDQAVFEVFRNLIYQKALIYAQIPFLLKALMAYQKYLDANEDVYSLKIVSIRKLTILNMNLNSIMFETLTQNLKALQMFQEANKHVWIKNVFIVPQHTKSKSRQL